MNKAFKQFWLFSLLLVTAVCFTYCLGRAVDFQNPAGAFGFSRNTLLYKSDQTIPPDQLEDLLKYKDLTILVQDDQENVSVFDPANYFLFHSYYNQTDQSLPYFSEDDYRTGNEKSITIDPDIDRTIHQADGTTEFNEIDCSLLSDEGIGEITNLFHKGIPENSRIYVSAQDHQVRNDLIRIFSDLPVTAASFSVQYPSMTAVVRDTVHRKKPALVGMLMVSLLLLLITAFISQEGQTAHDASVDGLLSRRSVLIFFFTAALIQAAGSLLLFKAWISLYYSGILIMIWLLTICSAMILSSILKTVLNTKKVRKLACSLDGLVTGLILCVLTQIIMDCVISLTERNPSEVSFILIGVLPICTVSLVILCVFLQSWLHSIVPEDFRSCVSLFTESGLVMILFMAIAGIPLFGAVESLLMAASCVLFLFLVLLVTISRIRKQGHYMDRSF